MVYYYRLLKTNDLIDLSIFKELQSTEFDDQRKDPQNLDGSEKKKSKNEVCLNDCWLFYFFHKEFC